MRLCSVHYCINDHRVKCNGKIDPEAKTGLYFAKSRRNVHPIGRFKDTTTMTIEWQHYAATDSYYDELIASGLTPIHRWGTPEDVAKAVVAIALDLLPFSTGEVINVDGGFHIHRL